MNQIRRRRRRLRTPKLEQLLEEKSGVPERSIVSKTIKIGETITQKIPGRTALLASNQIMKVKYSRRTEVLKMRNPVTMKIFKSLVRLLIRKILR